MAPTIRKNSDNCRCVAHEDDCAAAMRAAGLGRMFGGHDGPPAEWWARRAEFASEFVGMSAFGFGGDSC